MEQVKYLWCRKFNCCLLHSKGHVNKLFLTIKYKQKAVVKNDNQKQTKVYILGQKLT